jgi:hypothetical protein
MTARRETVWHKKDQKSKDMLLAGSFNPGSPPMRRNFCDRGNQPATTVALEHVQTQLLDFFDI